MSLRESKNLEKQMEDNEVKEGYQTGNCSP